LVKKEVEEILSDTASEANKKSKQKKKTMADSLLKAARARRNAESHKEKKKKSRSRSRSRRRRRKGGTARNLRAERARRDSSSSEGSMMAPLKKKSRKTPCSVFQMLEEQAIEQLSADGILEED
jgi:hypothetical protein